MYLSSRQTNRTLLIIWLRNFDWNWKSTKWVEYKLLSFNIWMKESWNFPKRPMFWSVLLWQIRFRIGFWSIEERAETRQTWRWRHISLRDFTQNFLLYEPSNFSLFFGQTNILKSPPVVRIRAVNKKFCRNAMDSTIPKKPLAITIKRSNNKSALNVWNSVNDLKSQFSIMNMMKTNSITKI